MPNPATPKPPRKSGWSPARRASHAAAIRRWAPWRKSTGPRTPIGKAKSAQNATKHGAYSLERRLVCQAFRAHSRVLRLIVLYRRLWRLNPRNELLARIHALIRTYDRIFHIRLEQALERERLCKNLAFSPPLRQKLTRKSSIGSIRRACGGADGDGIINDGHKTQLYGFQQTRKRNPRGGGHVGRGGFIRHGGAAARTGL